MDTEALTQILESNKDKNFVDRILNKENYPSMPRPDLGKGIISTHLMSWAEDGLGAFVYPEIVFDSNTKKLKRLGQKEAIDYAIKTDELIRFDNPEDADWFSKNYKQYWDIKSMQDQINKMNEATK